MIHKWVTENVLMGLALSILQVNTIKEWVILAYNDVSGIVSEKWEWNLFQSLNSVHRRVLEIQPTSPH